MRPRCVRLGEARGGLRRAQGVESDDAFDLGSHGRGHLGSGPVVIAGLARREPVAVDRRGEGRLHLGHGAGHGNRQICGGRRAHREALVLQRRDHLRYRRRRRAELLGERLRREEVVVVGRGRVGNRLRLGRQRGRGRAAGASRRVAARCSPAPDRAAWHRAAPAPGVRAAVLVGGPRPGRDRDRRGVRTVPSPRW